MVLLLLVHLFRKFVRRVVVETASLLGFWQYGTMQWDEFYRYLTAFLIATTSWAVFEYDPALQQHGRSCPSEPQIVLPGCYIVLSSSEWPISFS